MAYTPDWEPLADAFKRVVATGVPEDEAKRGISRAIADGKIRVNGNLMSGVRSRGATAPLLHSRSGRLT